MNIKTPCTWIQYRLAVANNLRAEHGCSLADALYNAESYVGDWQRSLIRHAESGGAFTSMLLNTLEQPFACHLRSIGAVFPAGYTFTRCKSVA